MLKINPELRNKNILLISPHSDDVSVNMGGAVLLLNERNKINPLLFYTGFRGVANIGNAEATQIREEEMTEEAEILGIEEPVFLQLKSYLEDDIKTLQEDKNKLSQVLEPLDPDIIFLPAKNDLQPRHKLATQITLDALKGFQSKKEIILFYYESVWSIFNAFEFDTVFAYDDKVMRKKLEAIQVHKSQLKRTPFDRAAQSLASFRACITPEQRIAEYGGIPKKYAPYFECFKKETVTNNQ